MKQLAKPKEEFTDLNEALILINDFFLSIESDPRVGPMHICLYLTLIDQMTIDKTNPISIRSRKIMSKAKIFGVGTYHRVIRDLNEFGYIEYVPSHYHRKASQVYLKKI